MPLDSNSYKNLFIIFTRNIFMYFVATRDSQTKQKKMKKYENIEKKFIFYIFIYMP